MKQEKLRILHFSPHNEDDGIAKYTEQYVSGMADIEDIDNAFFIFTPLAFRNQTKDQQHSTLELLRTELSHYDILHVQHEFGLFADDGFERIIQVAKDTNKKVVVSVHLSPSFAIKAVRLGGVGPRSLVNYLRQERHRKKMFERHIVPFLQADLLLVHNDITADALKAAGAKPDRIKKMPHPVYDFPIPPSSNFIAKQLDKQAGDIIYCTIGMMHRYKGVFDAIKALKFLPPNYKLAILGGVHSISEDIIIYNKVCDLIDSLGLHDRVYISGFVKQDNDLNAYIRECDISVFPYDGTYYAHVSSGAINLGFSNEAPVIAYPTKGFKELSESADGAVVLTETFAYYELAREIKRIDVLAQTKLSKAYAKKMAWPKMSQELAKAYRYI